MTKKEKRKVSVIEAYSQIDRGEQVILGFLFFVAVLWGIFGALALAEPPFHFDVFVWLLGAHQ